MTVAELQQGMATADGDCALGNRSASALPALPLGARKLAGLYALSNDLGHDGSQRLSVEPLQAAPQPSSVERPPKLPRRPGPDTSSSTATSSPEACDEGHDADWRGRVAAPCNACSNFIACVGPARAAGLASDAPSAHGVKIIDLEPRRRPHGRRFVLHRTCGPRFCPRCVPLVSVQGSKGGFRRPQRHRLRYGAACVSSRATSTSSMARKLQRGRIRAFVCAYTCVESRDVRRANPIAFAYLVCVTVRSVRMLWLF